MPWDQAKAEIPHERYVATVTGQQSLPALDQLLPHPAPPARDAHWIWCSLDAVLAGHAAPGGMLPGCNCPWM